MELPTVLHQELLIALLCTVLILSHPSLFIIIMWHQGMLSLIYAMHCPCHGSPYKPYVCDRILANQVVTFGI